MKSKVFYGIDRCRNKLKVIEVNGVLISGVYMMIEKGNIVRFMSKRNKEIVRVVKKKGTIVRIDKIFGTYLLG